ncbi:uncharacterized protein LOC122401595 [Colletes gigas]|uniref:uncharacterized protein LOC122401595 n=1 Tax=Colletes gigas TaxID=935657 RepID=UPI001C9B1CFA|nr:uncharacterized protein LOC122401595 [Colletes gigas]
MDIRIVALIVLVGIVGSFGEARSANIRMRRSPDGYGWTATSTGGGSGMASSFASSGAFGAPNYAKPSITDRGAFVDNTPQAANVPNYINPGGFGYFGGDAPFYDPGFAFPTYDFNGFQQHMQDNWRRLQDQIQRQQQQIFDTANRINTDSAQGTGTSSSTSTSGSQQSAVSSIQLGPGGGYHAAVLNPGAPGVESRFAEELPPPSGGSYGVFTSSSSNTMIGPDGKAVSHKVSTTGVNDNGKIHFRTVEV